MFRTRERARRGFTLVEVLLVLLVIAILSLVAYPTIEAFTRRDSEAGAATEIARQLNKARGQAKRRNRAYIINFPVFSGAAPLGLMEIYEGTGPSCLTAASAMPNLALLLSVPFGASTSNTYFGKTDVSIGLSGWFAAGQQNASTQVLRLCAAPDGSMWRIVAQQVNAVDGRLRLQVRRFQRAGAAWELIGSGRAVEVTFAGHARMVVGQ